MLLALTPVASRVTKAVTSVEGVESVEIGRDIVGTFPS